MELSEKFIPGDAGSLISNRDAQHYLIVTRKTADIPQVLPVALYGLNQLDSDYKVSIQQYAQLTGTDLTGIGITVAWDNTGSLVFTYKKLIGSVLKTDTIVVSAIGLGGYSELLNGLRQSSYHAKLIVWNNTYYVSQVGPTPLVGSKQSFDDILATWLDGREAKADYIRPNAFVSSIDSNKNVINLFIKNAKINPSFAMIQNIEPIANWVLEYDIMMQQTHVKTHE